MNRITNLVICSSPELVRPDRPDNPNGYVWTHRGVTLETWFATDVQPYIDRKLPIMLHGVEGYLSQSRDICEFRGKAWPSVMAARPEAEEWRAIDSLLRDRVESYDIYASPPDIRHAAAARLCGVYWEWLCLTELGKLRLWWDSGAVLSAARPEFKKFLEAQKTVAHNNSFRPGAETPWAYDTETESVIGSVYDVSTIETLANHIGKRHSPYWSRNSPAAFMLLMTDPTCLRDIGIDVQLPVPGKDYALAVRGYWATAARWLVGAGRRVVLPLPTMEWGVPGITDELVRLAWQWEPKP